MKEKNICSTCKFCLVPSMKCNRLVFTCLGMRDRLGEDFKRGNYCPYHEEGKPKEQEYKPLNLYNT